MARSILGAAIVLVVLCVCGEGQFLCSKRLDIIFAVDVSGSITSAEFSQQQAFLQKVVDSIMISNTNGARILVFGFDHDTNSIASSFESAPARWRAQIKQQINSIRLTLGATTMEGAIEEAKELFNTTTRNVPRVVVFLSDGVNYGGVESLRAPAQELRTLYRARVVGLGIGPANTVNREAFEILSGRNDRLIILTFKNTPSCSGGDDDDDDDDECECEDDDDDDDDDDDEGNCGSSELKRVVRMICG